VTDTELEIIRGLLQSGRMVVPVDIDPETGEQLDDDGCGDGRGVTDEHGNVVEVYQAGIRRKKSLRRAKLFGGGATMTLAALIGLGRTNQSLQDIFTEAMDLLHAHDIDFGAHIDGHAKDPDGGCGAIDRAPMILINTQKYREQIRQTVLSLNKTFNATELDEVLDNYASYVTKMPSEQYSGRLVLNRIRDDGRVVKLLLREHHEMFIVLNTIPGYTIDQKMIRDESHESIQAFVVDTWRGRDIAKRLFAEDGDRTVRLAYLSQLSLHARNRCNPHCWRSARLPRRKLIGYTSDLAV
jgi:hypothetical protein